MTAKCSMDLENAMHQTKYLLLIYMLRHHFRSGMFVHAKHAGVCRIHELTEDYGIAGQKYTTEQTWEDILNKNISPETFYSENYIAECPWLEITHIFDTDEWIPTMDFLRSREDFNQYTYLSK